MGFDLTIELVEVSESDKALFLSGAAFDCASFNRDETTGFWNQSIHPVGVVSNWRNQRDVASWFMGRLVHYADLSYMYVPQHVLKAAIVAMFSGDLPLPDGDKLDLIELCQLACAPAAKYPLVSVMWG